MARPKKAQKVKDPVCICPLKLANENMSLYLDVYVKGVRKVESLGLYLIGLLDFIKKYPPEYQIARQSKGNVATHAAFAPEYTGTNAQCGGKRWSDG